MSRAFRVTTLVALIGLGATGCQRPTCRAGTLFLAVDYGEASGTNRLRVEVAVEGQAPIVGAIGTTGTSGTVEVQFKDGYPRGSTAMVTVRALANDEAIAIDRKSVPLDESCKALAFKLITPPAPTRLDLAVGFIGGFGSAEDIGSNARFSTPDGVAMSLDKQTLYVADSLNHVIRKLQLASRELTTLAGSPGMPGVDDGVGSNARFYQPSDLVMGTNGILYVADTGNYTIRAIAVGTGQVTTIAGGAMMAGSVDAVGTAARFRSPRGLALDSAGAVLYIADSGACTIRQMVLSTQRVTGLAGYAGTCTYIEGPDGAAARFNHPRGLAVDAAGALYVADTDNDRIRKLVIANAVATSVTTVAGGGAGDGAGTMAGFDAPYELALDSAKNLYVSDSWSIRKVALSSATVDVTTLAGSATIEGSPDGAFLDARFRRPRGLVVAGTVLYAADSINQSIRKLDLAAQVVSSVAGSPPKSGKDDGGPTADNVNGARFKHANGMSCDGAGGHCYIADTENHTIRLLDVATYTVTTIAGVPAVDGNLDGPAAQALFHFPIDVALAGDTTLYVSEQNHTIRKLDLAAMQVSTLAGTAGVSGNGDGVGAAALFSTPAGLAADGIGNLYIADSGNHTVRMLVLATGEVSTIAGLAGSAGTNDGSGSIARFNLPTELVFRDGLLYVADTQNHAIRKLMPGTPAQVTTLAGLAGSAGSADGSDARFNLPRGLTIDLVGNLFVTDSGNHQIRKISPTAKVSTLLGAPAHGGVKLSPLPAAGVNVPWGIEVLPKGELLIIDQRENAILIAHKPD